MCTERDAAGLQVGGSLKSLNEYSCQWRLVEEEPSDMTSQTKARPGPAKAGETRVQ